MRRHLSVVLVAAAGLLAVACGENHINEDEATSGWRLASGPLMEGQQAIQQKAQENPGRLIAGESITHTVDCGEGGEVEFSLSVDLEGGGMAPDAGGPADAGAVGDAGGVADAGGAPDGGTTPDPEVDLTADYQGCSADGSTIRGELAIDSPQFTEFMPGGGESDDSCDCPRPVPFEYTGHLDFTGKIDGPCDVDMTAEIPPWGQPTYSGDLCGYDAQERLSTAF